MLPQAGIFLLILASAGSIRYKYARVGSNVTLTLKKNVTLGWMRHVISLREEYPHPESILRCKKDDPFPNRRCLMFVTELDTATRTTAKVLENGDLFIDAVEEYDSGLYSELIKEEDSEGEFFPESIVLTVLSKNESKRWRLD